MTSPIIRFDNFGFRYKEADDNDWALRNFSIDIEPGEILLAMGPSGCGKSTFALALNGAVPQLLEGESHGSVAVKDLNTTSNTVAELTQHVGMVFQDPEVQLFALTVEDEVAMSLESYGMPREEMRERVAWAMEVVGLSGMELNAPAKLSGGQKQRVAIAAVIAREPEILVFDEPTGNLDPVGTRSVYEAIRRICDARGRTIVLIEHDLGPVIDLVDKIVVLDDGQIIFHGNPREALRNMDLLHNSGVKVPTATEFAARIEKHGIFTYPTTPITLDEAIAPVDSRLTPSQQGISVETDSNPNRSDNRVIEFIDVTHQYDTGHKGIDHINLQVHAGEFLAVCGMNGAGKTTLALHVMGLLKPTEGVVMVDGKDTKDQTVAEMSRKVGLIFQNPNHQLFKGEVAAEIDFGTINMGWDDDRIKSSRQRVMDLVGLSGYDKWDPESLSIGQKQRVAIASVLVMEPRILLLDEPTTGQDTRTLEPFMKLVSTLNQQGMTVLMITHDMDVALRYASRILVMGNGKTIADGSPNEIFLNEACLEEAQLHLPGVLELTKRLNDNKPVILRTFDQVEEWLGLQQA